MKPLTFGAYLNLCVGSRTHNTKPTDNYPIGRNLQVRTAAALSRSTKRLFVTLAFLTLLTVCPQISTAQTPGTQLMRGASTESVKSTASVRENQPHPSIKEVSGPVGGGGSIFKRAARGILRFGKGLVSALRFGEGRNSSVAKSNPTSEKQDHVAVLKPAAAVYPPIDAPVVDLCELVDNWQKYNRQRVRVRAIYEVGAWLYDPACRQGEALTDVNLGPQAEGAISELNRITARDRRAWVTLDGTFYGPEPYDNIDPNLPPKLREALKNSHKRYGHLDSFNTSIRVAKIVEAAEVPAYVSASKN